MRRFLTLIPIAIWLLSANLASATMILQSYDQTKHDRFYVGEDKAFIGDPYDWSGVGRSGYWATMVSDHYFLSANHYHPTLGSSITFAWTNDPSGSYETRTVESGVQIAGTDLWLGKLSDSVSDNVAKYSILSLPNESDYNNLTLYTFGLSNKTPTEYNVRLGRNNIDPGSFQNVTTGGSTGRVYLYDYDNPGGQGDDESYLQGGDSGGPSFVAYASQPTLVGIHWFIWDDGEEPPEVIGSGDTFVSHYITAINSAMVGEQLTLVPEPATVVMLCTAVLTLLVYAWRRRS